MLTLNHRPAKWAALALLCMMIAGESGCICKPPALSKINLKEPGWTVRQGQAVWRRKSGAPEIAGDIVVATSANGRAFAQFSKAALPLMVAQSTPKEWEVETPVQNKHYSGCGRPPKQLIFLYLPRALLGESLPRGWIWRLLPNNGWHLENAGGGESLEGYFSQ